MAMIQTMFMRIVALIQTFITLLFFAPKNPAPIAYGGTPYAPAAITEWLSLFEDGETDYAIIYQDGNASIATGARWLEEFLEEMTGGDIAKTPLSLASQQDKAIYVGIVPPGADGADFAEVKDEGFVKKVVGDDVYIYGAGRGTMYGCADFIEQELGCRWYTPTLKSIPKQADAAIDANLNSLQNAVLEYRDVYWDAVSKSPEFKAFHKLNSNMGSVMGEEYGYGYHFIDFCHSMERLVPASYYAEHPEYFSYRGGSRTLAQRCLTNDAVFEIAKEKVFADIRSTSPNTNNFYSISQNDNGDVCQCENCLAMDAKYGGPSGTNVWFVNKIHDAVRAEFPDRDDIIIETLAYSYTTEAPTGIVPNPGVVIRLCPISVCQNHPMAECGHNKDESWFESRKDKTPSAFSKTIAAWSAICDSLYIWDYNTNYKTYSIPFPNFQTLSPNMKFFIENNTVGVFALGNYDGGSSAEFGEMRSYISAQLMWNADIDVEYTMTQFMKAFYGDAATPYLWEYLNAITRRTVDTIHMYNNLRPEAMMAFTGAEYKKFDALWDKAEENAAGTQLRNVQMSRLSLRIHKANLVICEFSPTNPDRIAESKKLFLDILALGVTGLQENEDMYLPYNDYVWALRPYEWADPIAWVDFVDESKVVPLDIAAYLAANGG